MDFNVTGKTKGVKTYIRIKLHYPQSNSDTKVTVRTHINGEKLTKHHKHVLLHIFHFAWTFFSFGTFVGAKAQRA